MSSYDAIGDGVGQPSLSPPGAASETAAVARLLWLKALFGGATPDASEGALDALAERMTEVFVPRGQTLYDEGSASDTLYFIVEGAIVQGSEGYRRFVAGDVLGFVDANINRPHAATAKVVEDAVILVLKVDDWQEHLEDHPEIARNLILSNLRGVSPGPDLPDPDAPQTHALQAAAGPQTSSGEFARQILAVRTATFFSRASIQACAQLTRRARAILVPAGDTKSSETLGIGLWVLVYGKVVVETDNTAHECTPGTLLGSLRSATSLPESTFVRAIDEAEILCISSEDLFDVMEDHFDVAHSGFRYLAMNVEAYNRSRTDLDHSESQPSQPSN